MRLKKWEKKAVTGLLTAALVLSLGTNVNAVEEFGTEIPYAQDADGTPHEYSFELARDVDDKQSSYEEDNGKHWVKLFSTFDGTKNIFDHEEVPDDTAKFKVVFDVTNYDLDEAYPLTWATGIGGWTSGKPTGVTIDQSGTYEAVLDIVSETDGIGRPVSPADLTTASLQLVFQLGASGQENIANVKKTKVTFKACYAYSEAEAEDVVAAEVIPIKDEKPSTEPSAKPSVEPSTKPSAEPSAKPSVVPSVLPSESPVTQVTAVPTGTPKSDKNTPIVSQTNKVKKIKPAKKSVTIKKGKKKTVTFKVTAADNNKKTTDKIVQAKVSNKKVAKVVKKSLGKKKCMVKLKGLKKGKTTLTLKIGSKKAKVKIKVK